MSIAALIEQMAAAGAPVEAIVIAVKAIEAERAKLAEVEDDLASVCQNDNPPPCSAPPLPPYRRAGS